MAEPATRISPPGAGTRAAWRLRVTVLGGSVVGGVLGIALLVSGPAR